MESVNVKETIIIYTYRYIYKDKDGRLVVKYITDSLEAHAKFIKAINDSADILSCIREYISEINFEYLGFTETVKKENKEDKSSEETV